MLRDFDTIDIFNFYKLHFLRIFGIAKTIEMSNILWENSNNSAKVCLHILSRTILNNHIQSPWFSDINGRYSIKCGFNPWFQGISYLNS